MDAWTRLRQRLDELSSQAPPPPSGGRIGAALALLREVDGDDLEIVLTRRRDDLSTHPGQISFPGGRVDPGEAVVDAALREAAEECALDPSSVTVLGLLPAFYIPPSRFWLQVVVARWDAPHGLVPAEAEVAEILTVATSELADRERWRVARLSARGESWAWALDGGQILWGATAIVTAVILGLIDEDWAGGQDPADLPVDREVRPWEGEAVVVPRMGPARLGDVPEVPVDRLPPPPQTFDTPTAIAHTGAVVADAVRSLWQRSGEQSVLFLVGPGHTGAVGLAAAAELAAHGVDVTVVLAQPDEDPPPNRVVATDALGDRVRVHEGRLPEAGLVVDALVGRGLRGPLEPPVLEVVLALRELAAPVVAIDLPSGVDPHGGLIGDAVSADVTLALGAPAAGLFAAGIAPFVGDLYLIGIEGEEAEAADPIVRVIPEAVSSGREAGGGWRE
jgi:hydroxyethylthiazole kinase-like uncharacterized protein yjeF